MLAPTRRALILSSRGLATDALVAKAIALGAEHDEVIVAFEGADMLARWMHARTLLARQRHIYATPLAPCVGLHSLEDRAAALVARLGNIDTLLVDSPAWLACARTVGLHASLVEGMFTTNAAASKELPVRSRALVVTRAQPFHRGHLALIEHGLQRCEEVVLVIAAAERSHARRDPFTAGERLALVRAGLDHLLARVWVAALPSPAWPAMALAQLAFTVPRFAYVVAHNPLLRAMCEQEGKPVGDLSAAVEAHGQRLSGTTIRARLEREGAGPWLADYLPAASAALLCANAALAERCALIDRAGA